ncbi:uncharacterized protein EV154DRAFT_590417, partial [Mucor mucedo]|uniref:uncharacterized protein n=1 Tax=Mucor mucedo TaxID=29922 RepID=UPI00221F1586
MPLSLSYTLPDHPKPGDEDLLKGVQELNCGNYLKALQYFETASLYEHEYGTIILACIYYMGLSDKRDPVKAFQLFEKAAKRWHNCTAQFFTGLMLYKGDGVEKSFKHAIKWLIYASKRYEARSFVGAIFEEGGFGVTQNVGKAILWYEKVIVEMEQKRGETVLNLFKDNNAITIANWEQAADFTSKTRCLNIQPFSVADIARYYNNYDKRFIREMLRDSFWYLMASPEKNVSFSQFNFAMLLQSRTYDLLCKNAYDNGGMEAKVLFCKANDVIFDAANNGHMIAQCIAGKHAVIHNKYEEAFDWYTKSKEKGFIEAHYELALLYFRGLGTRKDYEKSLTNLSLILKYGSLYRHGTVYFLMGKIYQVGGFGIKQDIGNAVKYYKKSVESGQGVSAAAIGDIYVQNIGIDQDLKKAFEWYSIAASMNSNAGKNSLGRMYLHGHHVDQDLNQALTLFNEAYEGGYQDAKKMIDFIELVKITEIAQSTFNRRCSF